MFQDLTERAAPVVHHSANGLFAIRVGKWKLVAGNGSGGREPPRGKPFQLYDMSTDIGETNDVAAQHPDVVQQLTLRLEGIRKAGRSREK